MIGETRGKRGARTSYYQKEAIVQWLEMEPGDNFKLITGGATKDMKHGVVAGKELTQARAFEHLADYVNSVAKANTEVWNSKRAENSYRAMLKNYKEVAREHRSNCGTKFGLSEFDLRSGINTIEQKLEKLCPFYHRMDRLFGDRPNVIPPFLDETLRNMDYSFSHDEIMYDAEVQSSQQVNVLPLLASRLRPDSNTTVENQSPSQSSNSSHSVQATELSPVAAPTISPSAAPVVPFPHGSIPPFAMRVKPGSKSPVKVVKEKERKKPPPLPSNAEAINLSVDSDISSKGASDKGASDKGAAKGKNVHSMYNHKCIKELEMKQTEMDWRIRMEERKLDLEEDRLNREDRRDEKRYRMEKEREDKRVEEAKQLEKQRAQAEKEKIILDRLLAKGFSAEEILDFMDKLER